MPYKKEKSAICQRVSVNDAAAEIGCHPQYLRQQMREKKWDLGHVIPPKRAGKQYAYIVLRAKLDKFLGLDS